MKMIFQRQLKEICSDGTVNICSFLSGAAWRAARALGYRRIITYCLVEESGVSLRAAGWMRTAMTAGGTWDRPSRHRQDQHPLGAKWRWEQRASVVGVTLCWPEAEEPHGGNQNQRPAG